MSGRLKATMKPLQDNDSTTAGRHDDRIGDSGGGNSAHVAEHIGITLLELSLQARGAGLTTLAFLLEAAALEAAASQPGYDAPPAS